MGEIHIDLFTTLDGVAQAPGGPEEDPADGFEFGGWQAPLISDFDGEQIDRGMQEMDALLLGRRTYDIFSAYWPSQSGPIAALFNRLPKYVASRGTPELGWEGTSQLGSDLVAAVGELRQRHSQVHVIGSLDLVQSLVANGAFDRLNLFVYPIVLGKGKKVFASGAVPTNLSLTEPALTSPTGTVILRYQRESGVPATGTMPDETPET